MLCEEAKGLVCLRVAALGFHDMHDNGISRGNCRVFRVSVVMF